MERPIEVSMHSHHRCIGRSSAKTGLQSRNFVAPLWRQRTHRHTLAFVTSKDIETMALNNAPDLTQHPPRSPRVRLGGYALLPRCLDKGRATISGKNGEYHYNCPLDQRFFAFVGVDADALKTQLQAGKG